MKQFIKRETMVSSQNVVGLGLRVGFLMALVTSAGVAADKKKYSIFNPTPENYMRSMATDRPDKTESAYTLDAGHFQHETDLVSYTYNQDDGIRTDSVFVMAPNLKVGLTNASDFQLIYQPYSYTRTKDVVTRERDVQEGSGDMLLRLKTNMWGNDAGGSAGAVMPYISVPVGSSGVSSESVEGGIIFPFAVALGEETSLGFQTQFDVVRNETDTDYFGQFVGTATVGTNICGALSGYTEVWVEASEENDAAATFDVGFTYLADDNTQFDAGVNIGITDAADDLNPFVGLSQRF